jgi:hypothetical protein
VKDVPEVQDFIKVFTSVADGAHASKVNRTYGTWIIEYPGIGGKKKVDIPKTNFSTNKQDVLDMFEHAQNAYCIASGWLEDMP